MCFPVEPAESNFGAPRQPTPRPSEEGNSGFVRFACFAVEPAGFGGRRSGGTHPWPLQGGELKSAVKKTGITIKMKSKIKKVATFPPTPACNESNQPGDRSPSRTGRLFSTMPSSANHTSPGLGSVGTERLRPCSALFFRREQRLDLPPPVDRVGEKRRSCLPLELRSTVHSGMQLIAGPPAAFGFTR